MVKIDVMLDEMPKSCAACPFKNDIDSYTLCFEDCMFATVDPRIRDEYKIENLYLPKDKRLKSCPLVEEEDEEEFEPLLTPSERADVLNTINQALEQKGINLEVGGYSDMDGVLFDVYLMRR